MREERLPYEVMARRYRELEDEHDLLLRTFSHDFGASLRQTRQFANLLLRKVDIGADPDATRYASLMRRALSRSDDMLDAVLELARSSAVTDAPALLDCVPLIREVLASIEARDVSLAFAGPSTMPMTGNVVQLRSLFVRLIDNAVRNRHADRALTVSVSASRVGTGWSCEVHDDGAGLSHTRFDSLFDLFRNIDSNERNTRVGLGLPVCRAIVRRHGGDIRCRSGFPGDTSFVFTLGTGLPSLASDGE